MKLVTLIACHPVTHTVTYVSYHPVTHTVTYVYTLTSLPNIPFSPLSTQSNEDAYLLVVRGFKFDTDN